jgi:hypothetical protein
MSWELLKFEVVPELTDSIGTPMAGQRGLLVTARQAGEVANVFVPVSSLFDPLTSLETWTTSRELVLVALNDLASVDA